MTFVSNKVALVTGGANGIGLAIVDNLLKNGIRGIGIVDVSEENGEKALKTLQSKYGDKIIFIKADVTVQKEFEDAFEKTIEKFQNIDIVVNNAGIQNEKDWELTLEINLGGVLRGTYLAVDKYFPEYRSSEDCVVLNTASIVGINGVQSLPTYCATKHGIVGLGKSLGGPDNYKLIKARILTICPGIANTDIIKRKGTTRNAEITQKEFEAFIGTIQSPEFIGEQVIGIINEARSGSIWVIENGQPAYEVDTPERTELRKKK